MVCRSTGLAFLNFYYYCFLLLLNLGLQTDRFHKGPAMQHLTPAGGWFMCHHHSFLQWIHHVYVYSEQCTEPLIALRTNTFPAGINKILYFNMAPDTLTQNECTYTNLHPLNIIVSYCTSPTYNLHSTSFPKRTDYIFIHVCAKKTVYI